jgi:type II secretory pathway pseudopilin PulG
MSKYICTIMKISAIRSAIKTALKSKIGKRLHLRQLPIAVVVGVAVIFVSGSAFAAHAIVSYNDAKAAQKAVALAKAKQAAQLKALSTEKSKATNKPSNTQSTQPKTTQSTTTQPVIKYKTSSDPRSTTYSTTPPKPNKADFTTTITHNGQVAPGTLIDYNAEKPAHTYYAGDYTFDTLTVTINKKVSLYSTPVRISTPDGEEANEPSLPWDVSYPPAYPFEVSPDTSGTTWGMIFSTPASQPDGTYTVHLTSFRLEPQEPAWEYDGFLTVVIEN